ncbi:MAG: polymer-forming cytoskeletal protein [Parcubacteria group bacterium]
MRTRQPLANVIDQPKIPETIVGASLKIEGELKSEGDIRIDGEVRGSVTTKGDVFIGQNAVVSATVQATNASIAGRVTGDIMVNKQLSLEPTARVKGNTSSSEFSVARGAQFNGMSTMSGSEAALSKPLASLVKHRASAGVAVS